jgi:hypothetical protein
VSARFWDHSRPGGQADLDELLKVERFADRGAAARRSAKWPDSPRAECVVHFGYEPFLTRSPFRQTTVDELRRWLASIGPRENVVWLDNSTIIAAVTLLDESQSPHLFTPLTVWDLATFVRAVVCFERIYHFKHYRVSDSAINRLLGAEVLMPLPGATDLGVSNGVARVLNELWDHVDERILDLHNRVGTDTLDGQLVDTLVQGWRKIVQDPNLRAQDLLDVDSADKNWWSPGSERLSQIADVTHIVRPKINSEIDSEIITDENYRALLNQRVADLVGVPYLPAVTRMPFRGLLNERKQAISSRLYAGSSLFQVGLVIKCVWFRRGGLRRGWLFRWLRDCP